MPKLPRLKISEDGHTYAPDLFGAMVCTGAKRGLKDHLPADRAVEVKLRMVAVPVNSGGYAPNGAYFGRSDEILFHAESVDEFALDCDRPGTIRMFVRAGSRAAAREAVRAKLPNAKFYR